MAYQKKPEKIADEDLEGAQGGNPLYFNENLKVAPKEGDGFASWGTATTTSLKKPGTNMEVVNEDE